MSHIVPYILVFFRLMFLSFSFLVLRRVNSWRQPPAGLSLTLGSRSECVAGYQIAPLPLKSLFSISTSGTTIYTVIQARNWGLCSVSPLPCEKGFWGMQLVCFPVFLQLGGAMCLHPGQCSLHIGSLSKVQVKPMETFHAVSAN